METDARATRERVNYTWTSRNSSFSRFFTDPRVIIFNRDDDKRMKRRKGLLLGKERFSIRIFRKFNDNN